MILLKSTSLLCSLDLQNSPGQFATHPLLNSTHNQSIHFYLLLPISYNIIAECIIVLQPTML